MVNKEFKKDLGKAIQKQSISTELSPGTPRRYEPAGGVDKHNERIHRESAYTDKYKKLPISFSKPKKDKRTIVKACSNCGQHLSVGVNCIGVICNNCNQYSSLEEVNIYD